MLNRTRRNPVLALAAAALLALGLRPPAALADHHLEGCGVEREACILRAIDTLAPGAPGQWTKGGKPKVGAIEAVAGIDITAAERDRAWSKYAGWKEQRHALEELRGALAEAESERDGYKEDAARRQAEVDDMGGLDRADGPRSASRGSAGGIGGAKGGHGGVQDRVAPPRDTRVRRGAGRRPGGRFLARQDPSGQGRQVAPVPRGRGGRRAAQSIPGTHLRRRR